MQHRHNRFRRVLAAALALGALAAAVPATSLADGSTPPPSSQAGGGGGP